MKPGLAVYAAGMALLAALDQGIKALVETHMDYHQKIELVPFFALFRTHNEGVAFSMLTGAGAPALLALSAAVMAFVSWLAWRSRPDQVLARIGFMLILAGAIGNVVDRAQHGYVIDYFLFHTPAWSFAIFNLADSFITVGAGLVILEEFLAWRREAGKG